MQEHRRLRPDDTAAQLVVGCPCGEEVARTRKDGVEDGFAGRHRERARLDRRKVMQLRLFKRSGCGSYFVSRGENSGGDYWG